MSSNSKHIFLEHLNNTHSILSILLSSNHDCFRHNESQPKEEKTHTHNQPEDRSFDTPNPSSLKSVGQFYFYNSASLSLSSLIHHSILFDVNGYLRIF